MPYFANSPEASLGRADSKNPATTCKGLTASGRPCRRALGASAGNSPNGKGVLAVLSHAAGFDDNPAAYYCWQHKDQAPSGSTIAQPDAMGLNNRSSIDTLMNRLGVLDIQDETPTKPRRKKQNVPGAKPVKRTTLPQQWQEVPGPLLSIPSNSLPPNGSSAPHFQAPSRPVRRRDSHIHFSFFCCGSRPSRDPTPPPRPRPVRPTMTHRPGAAQSASAPLSASQNAPSGQRPSQTALLKAWIPDHVAPATHSALMTELAKPLSQQDRDTGYIYMFWETPVSAPQPTRELTRSLMHDAVHDAWGQVRRDDLLADPWASAVRFGQDVVGSGGDALRAATAAGGSAGARRASSSPGKQGPEAHPGGTMMLKIGRADNVQRRMDQWTRQCGKNITLLRYYPYVSGKGGSASPSPARGATGRQRAASASATPKHPGPVANCARVERLIHVELADQRVMKQCDTCGKQHREWFAVPATRNGVQRVDETIRRWVKWGEQKAREDGWAGS